MSRRVEIFDNLLGSHQRRIDRVFLWLLIAEYVFGVVLALCVSPFSYVGEVRSIHLHVKLAFGLGLAIDALPIALILLRPGWAGTRHAVAVAQLLWSAIYIMITGGRIETHFHIFGSLAFLALYRDWRVIVTGTVVVIGDHLLRGMWWPQSEYGIADPQWWQFLEHAGWVVFEDVVLLFGGQVSLREMRVVAAHAAELEAINVGLDSKVESRTRALTEAKDRFRALVENIEAVPFEYTVDPAELTYIAPQAERILHRALEGDVLFGANVHPDDAERVTKTIAALGDGRLKAASFDYRVVDPARQIVHLRVIASARTSNRVHGVALDITKQQKLEVELRQAQKLESVGRLAAGVAHEINTPIQFVNDSVRFLQTAVDDVLVVVGKHQQSTQHVLHGDARQELALAAIASEGEVDLAFLATAMPEAIGRAVTGIDRVAAIVRSIKAFAHPDTSKMAHADLDAAIANTLIVARGEYKDVADVETDFGGLPPVECHVGEINQAILNLVVNASHAIGEGKRGTIRIATRVVGDHAVITIADTGCGIPEAIRDRIFDPFFTTKDVGAGTGQGLAQVHAAIVDKHHGSLSFESEVGAGTTFTIKLPLEQQVREAA